MGDLIKAQANGPTIISLSEDSHPGPQVFCVGVAQVGGSRGHIFTIKHHQTGQQHHQLVVITNLIEKEGKERNVTLIRSRLKERKVLCANKCRSISKAGFLTVM